MTDVELIHDIAERASVLYRRVAKTTVSPAFIAAELTIVHRNIVPLRLADFLAADDSNFAHDIGGIHENLEFHGATARLANCFLPRFAQV